MLDLEQLDISAKFRRVSLIWGEFMTSFRFSASFPCWNPWVILKHPLSTLPAIFKIGNKVFSDS